MNSYYPRHADKIRASAAASRARRIEEVRAYDRQRGHRVYDESKERARRAVSHAVARGKLFPKPCETCGATKAEAHHEDYSRPLDVRWLCRAHHMELHRKVAA
jgi:hypothetical protein